MNRKIIIGSILIVLLFGLGIGISMLQEYQSSDMGTEETITIEIEKGEGALDIARKLKEEGLIQYEAVFYLKAKNLGVADKLRYGTFTFYKGCGLKEVIEVLTTGKNSPMFTVPEGYSVEMIAKKLEEKEICTIEDFYKALEKDYDYWFLKDLPQTEGIEHPLQGFLYPSTYIITRSMTAEDIVVLMLDKFDEMFSDQMRKQLKESGKTVFELVTEASIIEREVKLDEERVMVAGVIKNRLEIDMKLQMCPTALYPITKGLYDKTTVTNEDTKFDSPYNTYVYKGLPVGPITNPSVKSLEAALSPAEHEYLFYHTNNEKKDGSHIFTKTYQEHLDTR